MDGTDEAAQIIETALGPVAVTFRKEVKDITYEGEKANPHTVSQRSGTLRYRWTPASLHFEEIR